MIINPIINSFEGLTLSENLPTIGERSATAIPPVSIINPA